MAGDWAYAAGWSVVKRVPEPLVSPALDLVADRVWRGRGRGVQRLEANLARALGDDDPTLLRTWSRRGMRSYLRYWGEVFRLPRLSPAEAVARVRPVDDHRLREAYAAGRGVVAALPHQGNWDLAGAWSCGIGIPLSTVAERLRPESLYDRFVAFREGIGMEVLPLTGGRPPVPVLEERLRAGGFVCLMADRDLSRAGVPVRLLGEDAAMPAGPALLARRTGAVLLPITTAYEGDHLRLEVHPAVEPVDGPDGVATMTQQVADAFTAAIRRDPADWHMLQRVFTADLDDAPRASGDAGAPRR